MDLQSRADLIAEILGLQDQGFVAFGWVGEKEPSDLKKTIWKYKSHPDSEEILVVATEWDEGTHVMRLDKLGDKKYIIGQWTVVFEKPNMVWKYIKSEWGKLLFLTIFTAGIYLAYVAADYYEWKREQENLRA